jgi:hypothetical protein
MQVRKGIPTQSYGNFGLDLAGALQAKGEEGVALRVELRVEQLVLEIGSCRRLRKHPRSGCLDDLVVLGGTHSSRDPVAYRSYPDKARK